MDAEDWEEFSRILDRRAIANSYSRFMAHMSDAANDLCRRIDQMIFDVLTTLS